MNRIEPRKIKQQSADILQNGNTDYRKTVLLHSALSFGALIIVMLLDLLLENQMAQTGGLSDMGIRSILGTAQGTLSTAVNILLPFWEMGILFTSMQVVRKKPYEFSDLTRGYQRFGPVLRYYLLQIAIVLAVAMAVTNVVAMAAMWLPVPAALQTAMEQIDWTAVPDPEQLHTLVPIEQLISYMLPILILFSVVYGAVLLHLHYRFRFSQYLLLDENKIGAVTALATSNRLTNGHKWELLRLDLSFWWFYALQIGAVCIAYAPELLTAAGITLPISHTAAGLISYFVYAAIGLAVAWYAGAYVQTAYACAYEQLLGHTEQDAVIAQYHNG